MRTEIETLARGDRFRTCITRRTGEVLATYTNGSGAKVWLGPSANGAIPSQEKWLSGGVMVEFVRGGEEVAA